MQFELWYDAADNRWYWHLKSVHGTLLACSPPGGFVAEENCRACIQEVQRSMTATVTKLPVKNLPRPK